MNDVRGIPESVQWHEGMLLSPQHFQQATRRADALLAYLVLAAAPYGWGIRRLVIDSRVLLDGIFRLDAVEAILPDGLVVVEPQADSPPLQLDLGSVEHDFAATPATVHLCVAAWSDTPADMGGVPRFRSVESRPIRDENTGDGAIAIPRLRPATHLFLTDAPTRSPPNLYTSIPIARIAFRDDGFALDSFIPPALTVDRDGHLFDLVDNVVRRLREKTMALSERLQGPVAEADQAVASEGWTIVRAMAQGLFKLEGLLSSGVAHPFSLYLALCDAVGGLACIDGQPCPPHLPPYVHAHPLPAFRAIVDFIDGLLSRVHEPYRAIRFNRDDDRFQLVLPVDWLSGRTLAVGARAAAGQGLPSVAEWMSDAWIGSTSRMRGIRERRILGTARRPVERIEELGLMPPRHVLLFAVDVDPAFIVAGETLEIASPQGRDAPGHPSELILYVPPDRTPSDRRRDEDA
ncbi:MAG: type VI secretion system baseplate subunit TssK [Rhodospirillales bacterium]|nr:type VI secretion system baseplate subunit TssK [Rhodospirillales bacterium]